MIRRTFLTRTNTIFSGSKNNFGLYPITMLNYGVVVSRALIYFDLDELKNDIDNNNVFPDKSKATHYLRMVNCGSLKPNSFKEVLDSHEWSGIKQRATSFELIAVKVNKIWDEGNGFDSDNDISFNGKLYSSNECSTWYNSRSGVKWDNNGVYNLGYITEEYNKYMNGDKDTIIVGRQLFTRGNEDLNIDITDYVNSILYGDESGKTANNRGIMIMFSPYLEDVETEISQYVGFFNNKTNTFYQPFVETKYNDKIFDDTNNFIAGRTNNLILALNEKTETHPICRIDGKEYEVEHITDNVYRAVIPPSSDFSVGDLKYVEWYNIKGKFYEVKKELPLEKEFEVKEGSILKSKSKEHNVFVTTYGIIDDEKLVKGEKRTIVVDTIIPYTKKHLDDFSDVQYKIYAKDGDKIYTVVEWDYADVYACDDINIVIDTNQFTPHKYSMDIMVDGKVTSEAVTFEILSETKSYKK